MRSRLVVVPYGPTALSALDDALGELRAGDPLAPATVVVARPRLGVAVRRELARAGAGLANVRFTTLAGVADRIAAPRLGELGRRAVPAVVQAALRSVLADRPGAFAGVADHPATETALLAALAELRPLGAPALAVLARRSPKAAELVRIHRDVRRRLAGWYDDHDVATAALDVARAPDSAAAHRLAELGAIVLYLQER